MAEIFLGELRGTKGFAKRVVLKVLKPEHLDDPEQQSMFADEARLGSKLEHAHIPRVIELGDHDGLPYMVQEYVEGPNLDVVMRRAKKANDLHLPTMCRIVADVARALDHAHHVVYEKAPLGVVHRDVSMNNVLVSVTGKAKLIDFGVARFEDRETKTEANVLKGKMRYLAPETLRKGIVSHQTDLFALGVVLYTVTTGRAPWRNQSDLAKRMSGNFTLPHELVPDYPPELQKIVVGAMAPKAKNRVVTGAEFADQLLDWCAANGGVPSDAAVSERVVAWFPEGRAAWVPEGQLDPDTFGSVALPDALPPEPVTESALGRRATAFIGLAMASALLSLAAVGILSAALYARRNIEPEVVVEVVDPLQQQEEAFLTVLEQGEEALALGELAELGRSVRILEGMTAADAELLARRQTLRDVLNVRLALEALEPLFETDPTEALERATALLVQHPDDEAVAAAVQRAETILADRRATERPVAPSPAPVSPAPAPTQPAVPSMLSVKGSPVGAEVVVDGRFVGTVPVQLVIDPGTHDVALRKDGYVQRRVHVEAAGGEPVEVSIELPPLQGG